MRKVKARLRLAALLVIGLLLLSVCASGVQASAYSFSLTNLRVADSSPVAGQQITLKVEAHYDNGPDAYGTVHIEFGVENPSGARSYYAVKIYDIPLGGSKTATYSYTVPSTLGDYKLDADCYNPQQDHMFATTGFQPMFTVTQEPSLESFTVTPSQAEVNDTVYVGGEIDCDGDVRFVVDWGDGDTEISNWGGSRSIQLPHSYTSSGTYTVRGHAEDRDGNQTAKSAGSVTITTSSDPAPTLTSFTADPSSAETNDTITASGYVQDRGDVRFVVWWGDGTTSKTSYGGSQNRQLTHAYSQTGSFTLTAYAEDGTGKSSSSQTRTITINPSSSANAAPTLSGFTASPQTVEVDETVTAGGGVDDDGLVRLVVEWGDGSSSQSAYGSPQSTTLSHSYAGAGTYTITGYAEDFSQKRSSNSTASVLVEPQPSAVQEFFDDFSYNEVNDPQFRKDWYAVDGESGPPVDDAHYKSENVFFEKESGTSNKYLVLRYYPGTSLSTSRMARIETHEEKFLQGTYAWRVRFTDTLVQHEDETVQTVYTYHGGSSHSELDFEYLSYNWWGDRDTGQLWRTSTLWNVTKSGRSKDVDPQIGALGGKWMTLVFDTSYPRSPAWNGSSIMNNTFFYVYVRDFRLAINPIGRYELTGYFGPASSEVIGYDTVFYDAVFNVISWERIE